MDFREKIGIVEDFPIEGISFKDITTLIEDGEALKECIDAFVEKLKKENIDCIVGPEARGFIFGVPVAYALGIGFIPVRKKGKLPGKTIAVEYKLEYGTDIVEIHEGSIKKGTRVAVIDDLLATGGTINAVAELIEKAGGEIVSMNFLIELTELKGREKLEKYNVDSLVNYKI